MCLHALGGTDAVAPSNTTKLDENCFGAQLLVSPTIVVVLVLVLVQDVSQIRPHRRARARARARAGYEPDQATFDALRVGRLIGCNRREGGDC